MWRAWCPEWLAAPLGERSLPPPWQAGLGDRRGLLDGFLDTSVEASGCVSAISSGRRPGGLPL